MIRLAHAAIRRPRAALAVWLVVAAVLAAIGLGASERLSPSVTVIPGTQSSRATELAEEQFGPSVLVPILLQGPERQVNIQGPKLVKDLSRRTDTRVLSAWSTGEAGEALRPTPGAAMIVASVARSEEAMVETVQPQIDALVDEAVSAPVTASVTGQPSIDRALKDEALDDARTAELIGVGILFLVSIALLGSVLAAAVVAVVGAATVLAGFGQMAVLGALFPVDPVAVTLASLAGLALGTGYALMIVRRFRQEETSATDRAAAARAAAGAVTTSGRAVLVGGTALIIAMVLAMLLSSIEFQFSVGVGVTACAAFGIGAAVAVLPAVLVLAGHRMDPWKAGPPALLTRPWHGLVAAGSHVVRRPLAPGALALVVLAVLALPLLSLNTGPPNITMLPESSQARQSFETVSRVMGPGWPTPYNVLIVSGDEPITSAAMLKKIGDLQERYAADDRVDSVVGPGAFRAQTKDLAKLPKGLDRSAEVAKDSKRDLKRLQDGLGLAGAGATKLQTGLGDAAGGAGLLQGGSGKATSGAGRLGAGLTKARSGAQQISAGLDEALDGAVALRDGAAKALAGSRLLSGGLGRADAPLTASLPVLQKMAEGAAGVSQSVDANAGRAKAASGAIADATRRLQSVPDAAQQPGYDAALSALASAQATADQLASSLEGTAPAAAAVKGTASVFAAQTAELAAGVKKLFAGSTDLAAGIDRLQKGNAALAAGLTRLDAGGGDLAEGLVALEQGADQLEAGLGRLTSGAGQLQSGLSGGVGPAGQLAAGLGTMESKVAKARGEIPSTKDLEKLKEESPGLFDSGYFVLAAIEGAPQASEDAASFAVNVAGGGNAGQIMVVPVKAAHTEQTMALGKTVRAQTETFAEANDLTWGVGGPAAGMADFTDYGRDHLVLVVAVISVVIALWLMVMLRSVIVPLVAVATGLLASAATFGVLSLAFSGDDPMLGGPGYLDPMSIIGIFAVVFGIAAIYETLMLLHTRARFVETGDAGGALDHGLRESAWPATGAAIAMIAVAVPFLWADLLSVRQFGLGLIAAVAIDSLIVRPVLLPALLALFGRRAWWPTRPVPPGAPPDGVTGWRLRVDEHRPAQTADAPTPERVG